MNYAEERDRYIISMATLDTSELLSLERLATDCDDVAADLMGPIRAAIVAELDRRAGKLEGFRGLLVPVGLDLVQTAAAVLWLAGAKKAAAHAGKGTLAEFFSAIGRCLYVSQGESGDTESVH